MPQGKAISTSTGDSNNYDDAEFNETHYYQYKKVGVGIYDGDANE